MYTEKALSANDDPTRLLSNNCAKLRQKSGIWTLNELFIRFFVSISTWNIHQPSLEPFSQAIVPLHAIHVFMFNSRRHKQAHAKRPETHWIFPLSPTYFFLQQQQKKSVLHRFTFKIELEIDDSSLSLIGARALFISFFYSRLPYISFDLKMPEIFLFIFVNDDSCSLKKWLIIYVKW